MQVLIAAEQWFTKKAWEHIDIVLCMQLKSIIVMCVVCHVRMSIVEQAMVEQTHSLHSIISYASRRSRTRDMVKLSVCVFQL